MKGRKKMQGGFSLIELLVAITIFVVGLLAVSSVQVDAMKHNSQSNTRTVAAALASERLELLLALQHLPSAPPPAQTVLMNNAAYVVNYVFSPSDAPEMTKVIVAVSRPGGQVISMTGLKAN